jgi:Hint module
MSAHCLASDGSHFTPLKGSSGGGGGRSGGGGSGGITTTNGNRSPSTSTRRSSKACFAADELVEKENGEKIKISLVKVGDRILSASRSGDFTYADVVAVPHRMNDIEASFAVISTASIDLKLTPDHFLMAGVCGSKMTLSKASDISVGSCLMTTAGSAEVIAITAAKGRGVYTVVTAEEFIVVNGVVASPFALNHYAANSFYNIFRCLYHSAPAFMKSSFVGALYEIVGAVLESSV